QQFASKVRRYIERGVGAAFAHFALELLQVLHLAHYTKRLRVYKTVDQLTALDGAILVENEHRHMFHVVVQCITERDHLDQRREKKEKQRQRIAPDDNEFLEENCAEPAKWFVFHLLYKERRSLVRRLGDLEIAPPWTSFASLRMTFIGSRGLSLLAGVLGRKL